VIARKVLEVVHNNAIIDWTEKKNVRTKPHRIVKRVLRHYDYLLNKQDRAFELVIQRAELSTHELVEG